MFKLQFQNFPQYFAWMRQHICWLTPAPCPPASLSELLKFQHGGRDHSAIVLAASRQLLLRLPVAWLHSSPFRAAVRTSLSHSRRFIQPSILHPVERLSFATCQSHTLPLRFCLSWRTPFASFRYDRGALPQAPEPTSSASVAYFVPHFRQPQVGQKYHFREFCIRKNSVFDIIRNYSHGSKELILKPCCRAYNSILCQIRTADCRRESFFTAPSKGIAFPTHPPARFFLIGQGFLTFTLIKFITFVVVLRTSTDIKTTALRLVAVSGCRLSLFPLPVCFAPAAGDSRQPAIRSLIDR